MDPINGVGINNNYALAQKQAETENEIQQDTLSDVPQGNYDDYSTMPQYYDYTEEKKSSAQSGVGLAALGAIGLATATLFVGKKWGANNSKKAAEAAKEAAKEATKKYEQIQQRNNEAFEIAEKSNFIERLFGDTTKKIKEALKPETKNAEKQGFWSKLFGLKNKKAADKLDDAGKKVADDVANSGNNVAK